MRDPERIDVVLWRLEKLWKRYPDLRFGQLLVNISRVDNDFEKDIFYMEDEDLYEKIHAKD